MINQIKKCERLNNVSVNVFSLNNKGTISPLFINNKEEKNHFDLFLINYHKTSHYCRDGEKKIGKFNGKFTNNVVKMLIRFVL
ncbi:Uncharacterized protein FWK35_00028595, partial [Aphis craccivora]